MDIGLMIQKHYINDLMNIRLQIAQSHMNVTVWVDFRGQEDELLEFHHILIKQKDKKNQSAGEWYLTDTLIYRKKR